MTNVRILIDQIAGGAQVSDTDALSLAECGDLERLTAVAGELRDAGHGDIVSYSRKVFIPLTHLCRDVCHYCTFAQAPRNAGPAYVSPDAVLERVREGEAAGCKEALFTLGDKPELRYRAAREGLAALGHETTLSYLQEVAELVLNETTVVPHLNPGLMNAADFAQLRSVSGSMGIMLESASERLSARGGPHFGSPDKEPAERLKTLEEAGRAQVPFTSGILIGIGETRAERIESLLALRKLHADHGHIQEIIVQNFRAKPDTLMADAPEPSLDELVWTIAVARLIFGPEMSIQAPPNLSPDGLQRLIAAGINDWGGVSPVTPDFVNPEAPWPHLTALADETAKAGKVLTERLTIYPQYARDYARWLDPKVARRVLDHMDADGFARVEDWTPGIPSEIPQLRHRPVGADFDGVHKVAAITDKALSGDMLNGAEIERLFSARHGEVDEVCKAADTLRRELAGDTVSYVVNRNINYTNVCTYRCQFCAFSKGKLAENLRGKPYVLDLDEITRRVEEAWARGATEVCLQGGIHPGYTGDTYIEICRAVKSVAPDIHIHAFTPLEITQGARTIGLSIPAYLEKLAEAGLGTLPGTAAEILDDEVRAIICADKVNTQEWLDVMEAAHSLGLKSTVTIMFGHVDGPVNWARHLLRVRALQERTGGFTEFVPLPFVAQEAPIYLKGRSRRGPTFREALLMHAVSRLALGRLFRNVQTSWVKMGPEGTKAVLQAGANDLGGTLMNESITRAAGASFGEELPPAEMERLIRAAGRDPLQRTTLYGGVSEERREASFDAPPLGPIANRPAKEYERVVAAD